MPEQTFFRRFKILLTVLAICIVGTTYWGVFQYHEIKLKDRVCHAVYKVLQSSNFKMIQIGKFEQIVEEKNQIQFTLELKSDPVTLSDKKEMWNRVGDDLSFQIIVEANGKIKMIGEMKN